MKQKNTGWVLRCHLEQYGAVSKETVYEMARGVRNTFGEKTQSEKIVGISISGIAGPGGGLRKNQWVRYGWCQRPNGQEAVKFHFQGDRSEVKTQSAKKAMELLIGYLQQK